MFVFEEDKIFCEDCYQTVYAKKCHSCHRAIVGVRKEEIYSYMYITTHCVTMMIYDRHWNRGGGRPINLQTPTFRGGLCDTIVICASFGPSQTGSYNNVHCMSLITITSSLVGGAIRIVEYPTGTKC